MKKFLLILLLLGLPIFSESVSAQETTPKPPTTQSLFDPESGFFKTDLKDYTNEVLPDGISGPENRETKGEKQFKNVVTRVKDYLRKIMIPIAVLLTVWGGFHLIVSRTDQELLAEKKRYIYTTAIGFIVLFLATVTVDNVFFGEYGEALDNREITSEFAYRGFAELQGLFRYTTTFVVAIAVGFVIFSAIKLIIAAGEREEEVANLKKRLVYTLMGMALLVSAQSFVQIFMKDGRLSVPDIPQSLDLLVRWGNFILGFLGILAVFGIVYSGVRLVMSMGIDEEGTEDAKNILKASAIGLVVAFSAWTLMYYFVVPY
ncbi:pilin [Candidatus Gracilibacteria bacterium]|nr:pilin [Candidatus Gracilibacteria bacterium]